MNTYMFECTNCKKEFEVITRYEDIGQTPKTCPECNHIMVRKFTAPTIVYKGRGFYSTDSKSRTE